MATPWASKRTPKLLRAAYLGDEEYLLEETRASKLLYFPGPVVWTLLFAVLAYLSWAAPLGLPDVRYYTRALGRLASFVPLGFTTFATLVAVVCLLLVVGGLLGIAVRFLRWSRTVYAVTSRRVLVQRGILGRDFDEIPVSQVRGVDVKQTAGERLLGYGTVRVSSEEGTGVGNEDWKGIPHPFKFQKLVENATASLQTAGGAGSRAKGPTA